MKFFERPFFLDPVSHSWRVIDAHDLADIHTTHAVIRSERKLEVLHFVSSGWP
jgi:hypothetical protein